MSIKKLIDLKKIDDVIIYNKDYLIEKNFSSIKIIYSKSNDILIKLGAKNEWLSRGEVYITKYGSEIIIESPFGTEWNVFFVRINSRYLDKLIEARFYINQFQIRILNSVCEQYEILKANMDNEISFLMIKSMLEQFFLIYFRNCGLDKIIDYNKESLEIVDYVTNYFNEHIGEKIEFKEIVKRTGISSTGIKNIFKKHLGMGVMQYYNYMKIERAKALLLSGELNITQIANQLGYDSIHYFSRQFKNASGLSPTQFIREKHNI